MNIGMASFLLLTVNSMLTWVFFPRALFTVRSISSALPLHKTSWYLISLRASTFLAISVIFCGDPSFYSAT